MSECRTCKATCTQKNLCMFSSHPFISPSPPPQKKKKKCVSVPIYVCVCPSVCLCLSIYLSLLLSYYFSLSFFLFYCLSSLLPFFSFLCFPFLEHFTYPTLSTLTWPLEWFHDCINLYLILCIFFVLSTPVQVLLSPFPFCPNLWLCHPTSLSICLFSIAVEI